MVQIPFSPDEQVNQSHFGFLSSCLQWRGQMKALGDWSTYCIVKQGNMGVPLPRGLRCQGSAWYSEVGHCPKSQGWRYQGRGGGEGTRQLDDRGSTLLRKTKREGEGARGGESALFPPRKTQSPPGDGAICGKWKSLLLYSALFFLCPSCLYDLIFLSFIHFMWPWPDDPFIFLDIFVNNCFMVSFYTIKAQRPFLDTKKNSSSIVTWISSWNSFVSNTLLSLT